MINREEKRDAIFFTKQLVRLDSSNPGNYEKEIKDYIELILPKEGVVISTSEVLPNRYNLMAEIEGEIKTPAMIFICHMDTVMLGEDWTKDPLGAEEIDGKIYGRGACDMKSGLACAISVFSEIAREVKEGKKLKHSLKLICSADEEDFMRGVEKAIADGWV